MSRKYEKPPPPPSQPHKRMLAALQRLIPQEPIAIHAGHGEETLRDLLKEAEGLRGYEQFLEILRERKATTDRSERLEASALLEARNAEARARTLSTLATRVAMAMAGGGALQLCMSDYRAALEESGPAQARDLWAEAIATPGMKEYMDSLGVGDNMLARCTDALQRLDLEFSADPAGILVRSIKDGRRVALGAGGTKSAAPLRDLLFASRLDAAMAMLADGHEVPLVTEPFGADEDPAIVDPALGIVAAAATMRAELARHVRKLEDTKLATYEGQDPTGGAIALGLLIVGIIFAGIGSTILIFCSNEDGGFNNGPGDIKDQNVCLIGRILLLMGFGVAAIGGGLLGLTYLVYGGVFLGASHGVITYES